MIGKVQGGGGMQGIPSNLGSLKAYCQKQNIALSKGTKKIPLKFPFDSDKIVGAIALYGGCICGQALVDNNGNYNSEFGLSFQLNYQSKMIIIYSSGSYSTRELHIMIFYV